MPDMNELLDKAEELIELTKYEESKPVLKEAAALEPNNPRLAYLLGRLHMYLYKFDKSIDYLKKAIKLKKDYADAYCYLSSSMAAKADSLDKQGGPINKARALKIQVEAKGYLDKSLELDPKHSRANTFSAFVDLRVFNNSRAARKKLETALKSEEGYATPMIYMAWLELKDGHFEKAKEWADKALEIVPKDDTWAYFFIAKTYAKYKHYDLAKPLIDQYMSVDPECEDGQGKILARKVEKEMKGR